MITGPEFIRQLEDELQTLRHEVSRSEGERSEFETKLDQLVQKRGTALIELAKLALPELSQSSIASTYDAVQDELAGILSRRDRRVEQVSARHQRLQSRFDELNQKQREATANHESVSEQLAQLEKKIATFLQNDPDFQTMSNAAMQAEMKIANNEARLEELAQDAKEKLPAYNESSLFRYLQKRNYATTDYAPRGLTQQLDKWVARLIDYTGLKQSYEFLIETPAMMEEELKRRQVEFHELMDAVEEAEQQAAATFGLPAIQQQHRDSQSAVDELSKSLSSAQETLSEVHDDLVQLDSKDDDFYQEALGRIRSFLSDTETAVLKAKAESTLNRDDDDLVSEIGWINGEIDELEQNHGKRTTEKTQFQTRVKDLEFVIRRCQQTEVSTDRCSFSAAFQVKKHLREFRDGAFDGRGFWELIQKEMKVKPRWSEETRDLVTNAMRGPNSRILFQAMTHVAAIALRETVGRGLSRRNQK